MTILVAVMDTQRVVVASDTQSRTGDVLGIADKWYLGERWAIGHAGDGLVGWHLEQVFAESGEPKTLVDLLKQLRDVIVKRCGIEGRTDKDEPPDFGQNFLIVDLDDKHIWFVDGALYPEKWQNYAAHGAPLEMAIGALAAQMPIENASQAALKTIEVCIDHHARCGGRAVVYERFDEDRAWSPYVRYVEQSGVSAG